MAIKVYRAIDAFYGEDSLFVVNEDEGCIVATMSYYEGGVATTGDYEELLGYMFGPPEWIDFAINPVLVRTIERGE